MIRVFFQIRNYAAGTAVLAYIIYCCLPQLNFGWILLATVLAAMLLGVVLTKLKKVRQPSNRL